MDSTEEKRVGVETIKLLMQVAWADGDVDPEEVAEIKRHAERAGLGERALALLDECMGGDRRLPAPDMGFLREHADEVMASAEQLICADGEVTSDEQETLEQIRGLLGAG